MARASDNGPLSRLRFPRGCVAFTVLERISRSQRLSQPMVVGIGLPGGQFPVDLGGLLDGRQRVLPPAQVGQAGRKIIQRSDQVGPDRVRVGRGGRRPRSLMLFVGQVLVAGGEEEHVVFAVAAEVQQVTAPPGTMERSSAAADWELATRLVGRASLRRAERHPA